MRDTHLVDKLHCKGHAASLHRGDASFPGRNRRTSLPGSRQRLENQLRADINSRLEAAINRASVSKEPMNAVSRLPMRLFCLQFQPDVNTPNNQHMILEFDLAHCLGDKPIIRSINLTRFQRAS